MSKMRGGMKSIVSGSEKESTASKILTWVLLAAALAMLVYRMAR